MFFVLKTSFCYSFVILQFRFVTFMQIIRNHSINRFLWIIRLHMHPDIHFPLICPGKYAGNEPVDLQGVFHIIHRVIHSFAHFTTA